MEMRGVTFAMEDKQVERHESHILSIIIILSLFRSKNQCWFMVSNINCSAKNFTADQS